MTASFSVSPRYARDPFAHAFDDLFRGYLVRPATVDTQANVARGIKVDVTDAGNNYIVKCVRKRIACIAG